MAVFDTLSASSSPDPAHELFENDAPTPTRRGINYRLLPEAEAAVDVAIGLGRPLLVAGEPGSGKTELGYAVARRLNIPSLYFFSTKSTSEASDLFYVYDAVGRFREAQLAATKRDGAGDTGDAGDFIRYQALGRALMVAHGRGAVADLLKGSGHEPVPTEPRRSVVIIDEIDKAPRDFTNDLLREIEDLSFRVPELANRAGERIATPPGSELRDDMRPIIIITSNEESQMPDAFLRRCVFLPIEFPGRDQLKEILQLHLGSGAESEAGLGDEDRDTLLTIFENLRNGGMQKNPGIAELIDAGRILANRPAETTRATWVPRLASALIKLKSDSPVFKLALDKLPAPLPLI